MRITTRMLVTALVPVAALLLASGSFAQDWPQWRGPNRDAKAVDFDAPATWPEQLTQKWKVAVGDGVATPSLVGDKLYVFTREGGNEVLRCLNAATGEEIWQDSYEAAGVRGPASSYSGPRSSPTVSDGKVVTLGVQSVLSCLNASTGEVLWRNDEYEGTVPLFYPSSSPIVVDGLCVAQLGGDREGGILAYDLISGEEQWRWTNDGPAYGSPVLMTVGNTNVVIAPTQNKLVALKTSDGQVVWEINYSQGSYNAATPIVAGQTLVLAGPGTGMNAFRLDKQGDKLVSEKVWGNTDNSVIYNTPVLKDHLLVGLSNSDMLFCINTQDGQTAWSAPVGGEAAATPPPPQVQQDNDEGRGGRGRRGFGGGRRGGGRGRGGYGSVVDAGAVLLALTPSGQLVVIEPSGDEFKQLASYKVADGGTHAYPVLSGNRIFIKDQDSVALWTID